MSSLVAAGYGFGAIIWFPVETSFVNPDNVPAVTDRNCTVPEDGRADRCDKYFEDPDVIARFIITALLQQVFGLMYLFTVC